jgi:hypothetical protein
LVESKSPLSLSLKEYMLFASSTKKAVVADVVPEPLTCNVEDNPALIPNPNRIG